MFQHVRKWLPWRERERRKKEFLNKLKGTSIIRIDKNVPVGSIFIVLNHDTGDMNSFCNINENKWTAYGSDNYTGEIFSKRSLEMHLSKLIQEAANKKSISIIDSGGWIERTEAK